MSLSRRSPSRFLRDLKNQLGQWFPQGRNGDSEESNRSLSITSWRPKTDVYEEDDGLVFEVEAPGLHKNDLDVQFEDGLLTISGERRDEREVSEKKRNYYRSERFYGSFQRSFRLPENVEADDIKAEFNDGVLTVRTPHFESSTSSSIEIT